MIEEGQMIKLTKINKIKNKTVKRIYFNVGNFNIWQIYSRKVNRFLNVKMLSPKAINPKIFKTMAPLNEKKNSSHSDRCCVKCSVP